jgi:branched-chain amino acid transport system substrate-binding protein
MFRHVRSRDLGGRIAWHLLMVFAVGIGMAFSGTARAAEPIKIGYVGGITGVCAPLTPFAINAMKMATKEINDGGGILGRPLEVIYRDSKSKPDEGAKQARDLILSEHVNLLTGVCSSSVFMAVAPVADQYHVPLISALSGTHKATVDLNSPYVFQTQPNTLMEGRALAEYAAKQKGWKRVVTMGLDYEWGRTTVQVFEENLKKLRPDVQIVKQLWPPLGDNNMTSYITAALAENPDVIMTVMFGNGTIAMIKQGEAYGLLKRTKMIAFLPGEALFSLGTQIPDGVYAWARAPFYAIHTAKADAFVKKYRAEYNEYPADWALLAYDAMYMIKDAIEGAKSTDPMKFRDAMAKLKFDGLRGKMHMRELDNTWDSPVYLGITKKVPEYPFPILTDVDEIPGNVALPSVALVEQLRKEAKKQ